MSEIKIGTIIKRYNMGDWYEIISDFGDSWKIQYIEGSEETVIIGKEWLQTELNRGNRCIVSKLEVALWNLKSKDK